MKRFLVKMDGNKSRTFRTKDAAMFGERNEGIVIEGESQDDSIQKWDETLLPGNRYNTFYLKITEISLTSYCCFAHKRQGNGLQLNANN